MFSNLDRLDFLIKNNYLVKIKKNVFCSIFRSNFRNNLWIFRIILVGYSPKKWEVAGLAFMFIFAKPQSGG